MIKINAKLFGFTPLHTALRNWERNTAKAVERGVAKSAQLLRRRWVTGIRNQAPGGKKFKPLAPSTEKAKGSSKALIDSADMIRSINVQKIKSGKQFVFFVGIHRTVIGKDGENRANIAEIHETGSIKVKDRPPKREHMAPSWDEWKRTAENDISLEVARVLGLKLNVRTHVVATGSDGTEPFSNDTGEVI